VVICWIETDVVLMEYPCGFHAGFMLAACLFYWYRDLRGICATSIKTASDKK